MDIAFLIVSFTIGLIGGALMGIVVFRDYPIGTLTVNETDMEKPIFELYISKDPKSLKEGSIISFVLSFK